jgi:hypothetical protein
MLGCRGAQRNSKPSPDMIPTGTSPGDDESGLALEDVGRNLERLTRLHNRALVGHFKLSRW